MFTRAYRTLVSGVADLVWPRHCWLCESESGAALCDPCRTELTSDGAPVVIHDATLAAEGHAIHF